MGAADEPVGERLDDLGPTLAGSDSDALVVPDGNTAAAGTSTPDTPLGSTLDRQRAIEIEEHAANTLRLRHALKVGAILWSSFFAIDWFVVSYVEPGPLARYALFRAIGLAIVLTALVMISRPRPPGPPALRAYDMVVFGGVCTLLALMCLDFRGLESPYAAGIHVAIICRGAFMAQPWREGVWQNGIMAISYPAILLGSTLLSDEMAAQAADPAVLGVMVVFTATILGTAALAVFGGHVIWSLRRQVFEARNIGRYRMVRQLGKGGMGEIWAAHHPGLKRDVALKILRPGARDDGIALRRFEREVQATTELSHPNTVRVFDYGVTPDGLWYYAMELLEGVDLDALVARDGPLPPERAVHLLVQASRALAEAHGRGIIHRDIKPHNVFITTAGGEPDFVKVLDFGIAKLTGSEADLTLTNAGWIGGTPAYMSPEAASGSHTDARADVYSLGATMYFALTGSPPFEGTSVGALLTAHQKTNPTPPSRRLGAPLPASLEAIVMRCLAKSPDERYADAAELADALAEVTSDALSRRP